MTAQPVTPHTTAEQRGEMRMQRRSDAQVAAFADRVGRLVGHPGVMDRLVVDLASDLRDARRQLAEARASLDTEREQARREGFAEGLSAAEGFAMEAHRQDVINNGDAATGGGRAAAMAIFIANSTPEAP